MTPYQKEQVEIIRRIAERGRKLALLGRPDRVVVISDFVDLFQHILDELKRLKNDTNKTNQR